MEEEEKICSKLRELLSGNGDSHEEARAVLNHIYKCPRCKELVDKFPDTETIAVAASMVVAPK